MNRKFVAATVVLAMGASAALAEDRLEARALIAHAGSAAAGDAETVSVDIRAADGVLWAGTLTMGPQYGNANYSQSKNEFAQPCDGKPMDTGGRSNTNNSLNFNISRANWQQEPDKFNVNFNWTRALRACEGQGSDTFGFNRTVEIERGGSISIEGANGAVVTISRAG